MNLMDFTPMRTPQEKEELFYKLQRLRTVPPLAITGDMANHISVLFNKTRKSSDNHTYSLIEKIHQFHEYWSQLVAEYEAEKKSASANSTKVSNVIVAVTASGGGDGGSGEGGWMTDWKDHDQMELDSAIERIKFLEEQLSSGADTLIKTQVKCADYDLIVEKNIVLEQENENLKRLLKENNITGGQSTKKDQPTRSLRGKLQSKMAELFQLRQTITGNNVKKSSSAQNFSSPSTYNSYSNTSSSANTAVNNTYYLSSGNGTFEEEEDPDAANDQSDDADDASNSQGVYSEDQQLLSEIEEFQKQIQALVHEKNELLRVNMNLEEELHDLQSKLVQWESKNQRLHQEIEKHQTNFQTLQQQKDTLDQTKQKMDVDYKNQMKINKVLISTVNKLETELKDVQSKYEIITRENNVLHTEIITNKNHLLELMERNNEQNQSIQNLEQTIQEKSSQIEQQTEKMSFLQSELIKEKERNASLQSDFDIIVHEKERIAHALELTQKKLIQREETLEELLTINGLSTTPIMNSNTSSASGSTGNLARFAAAFTNRERDTSPLPGGRDGNNTNNAANAPASGNINNKIMQFALSAKQLSMSKLQISSQKFKDAISGSSGNSEQPNGEQSTVYHSAVEGNSHDYQDYDDNHNVGDDTERRLMEQLKTAAMYPNDS